MQTGRVNYYNDVKGYGFIWDDESGQEFFFSATDTLYKLKEGDDVSYDVVEGRMGPTAVNVQKS